MRKKMKCILLVDDDEATNFINEIVLKRLDCTEKLVVLDNALDAIEFLKQKINDEYQRPDLIFLDINMPAMNGWEFMEEYKKLSPEQHAKVVLIMLTTSLNPYDLKKAKEIELVHGFENKPLLMENMKAIIKKYFPESL
jgi:CheY-like chemotaxis protein